MTGLAKTSYSETTADPAALLELSERDRIENVLVDTLVPAIYPAVDVPGGGTRWTRAQALTWLRFLARHLDRLGTTDLAWWQLQHALHSRDFRLVFGLFTGIAVALVGALTGGLKGGLQHGLMGGLKDATFGLMFGLAAGLAVRTSPEPGVVRCLAGGLLGGLAGGIAYGVIDIETSGFPQGLVFGIGNGTMIGMLAGLADDMSPAQLRVRVFLSFRGLVRPLTAGVALGLFLSLVSVLLANPAIAFIGAFIAAIATSLVIGSRGALGARVDITRATSPSSVWQEDRTTAVVYALVSSLTGAVVVGLVAVLVTGPAIGVEFAVLFGVMYGLAGASFTAWYRYLIARAYLSVRGRLPWSLMAFLADAHRRGLLRQVGAVYQFRHARLQE
ncbi:MAG TPA: hypothetical protein VJT72_14270 [Pseudonocardiaceae bacterium]|nr:hypothetical protein [Pseudonocardiaceae bacterium]